MRAFVSYPGPSPGLVVQDSDGGAGWPLRVELKPQVAWRNNGTKVKVNIFWPLLSRLFVLFY